MVNLAYRGQQLVHARALQLHWRDRTSGASETVSDAYVRGQDCVVTYTQEPQQTVRPQVYWRALVDEPDHAFGVELIMSMQTSLLHCLPTTDCISVLPCGNFRTLKPDLTWQEIEPESQGVWTSAPSSVVLFRHPELTVSLLTMVHPDDYQATEVRTLEDGLAEVRCKLFDESLEKGVIRRGRVRFIALPRDKDEQLAVAQFGKFAAIEPPLTT
jgi:hypothetical protein